jgi:2-phosphoglycerate kinase
VYRLPKWKKAAARTTGIMAKLYVTDPVDNTRVPFLRGILTGSLSDAGLSFGQAYKLASEIRDQLSDKDEVTTFELRRMTLQRLREIADGHVVAGYQAVGATTESFFVLDEDGQRNPFSRYQHQRSLESCGLSADESAVATAHVLRHLVDRGEADVSCLKLRRITEDCLARHMGRKKADHYRAWIDFTHSGRPLVLLIGGATGSGKSTIATEIAHRLGIVRTQSTDMLREVMRMMIPERLMPVIHTSSFFAWTTLPVKPGQDEDLDELVAEGFLSQAEALSVPCEAVIQRALRERVSLIIEGVHINPAMVKRLPVGGDAIVVPVMLAVLKEKQLRRRLGHRSETVPGRAQEQHLEHFDAIWRMQSFLLSEADRAGIPIINNNEKETTINLFVDTIIAQLMRQFPPKKESGQE